MHGEGLNIPSVLMVVGALAFFAHIFQYGFERYKIPDTLWLIGIGLVLGPMTGWVKPGDFGAMGQVLTTIALAVILFEAGIDLKLEDLRAGWRGALLLTLIAYGITFVAVSVVIYYLMKMPFEAAIFGGAVICGAFSACNHSPAAQAAICLGDQSGCNAGIRHWRSFGVGHCSCDSQGGSSRGCECATASFGGRWIIYCGGCAGSRRGDCVVIRPQQNTRAA